MAVWLHACDGGSGSSGFDVSSENTAIRQALNEQRCVARDGLMICPAGSTVGSGPTHTPTRTPFPTAPATATITATAFATPAATATGTAAPAATATRVSAATATAAPTLAVGTPGVDTALDGAMSVACAQVAADAPCTFILPFAPVGFPADAVYAVAVRTDGSGRWSIGPALTANAPADGSSFDAPVAVPTAASPGGGTIQLAVLVFLASAPAIPEEVQQLADSGASFAFVTPELAVQAQPLQRGSP